MGTPTDRQLDEHELVYDWNTHAKGVFHFPFRPAFVDQTLRDGLQNPSVHDPCIQDKICLLHRMEAVGIEIAEIGLPGASQRNYEHTLELCREVERSRMRIAVSAAARTLLNDVQPIIEISQRVGIPIECYVFVSSSAIRQFAEDWELKEIVRKLSEAVSAGTRAGLRVAFVTEDATRSLPRVLAELIKVAVEQGATRICLADSVGHATTEGVRAIVGFTRSNLAQLGATDIGVDWHGHNDRGLALCNSLEALEAGADRIHATALGIGERVGNTPMELVLVNLKLLGAIDDRDLSGLVEYCSQAARMLGWPVPINYPVFGRDAFRTATGVHAAAIMKAEFKGSAWLADRIYSSVPAGMFGRVQQIDIGYMSGSSNVVHWLREKGIDQDSQLVATILQSAKDSDHILTEAEVAAIVQQWKRHTQGSR